MHGTNKKRRKRKKVNYSELEDEHNTAEKFVQPTGTKQMDGNVYAKIGNSNYFTSNCNQNKQRKSVATPKNA